MKAEISRRSLMKTSALGSLALASSAFTLPFSQMVRAAETPVEEKAVWSSCTVNCGSRCLLRLHVKDDTVYWVESDTTGDDVYGNHQVRACLRGRSIRRRMNHPDRLKYPMKRVGKRGEGKFERISWDEALDTISDNLRRILKDYGNEAVHVLYGTGVDGGNITNSNVPYRLMNSCGGFLSRYGSYSTAQISAAMSYMFGANDGNSPDDIANTKLVVMFGNNPAETRMSGGGVTYYVACKDFKDLGPEVSFRRIYEYAGGDWQEDNGVWHQNVFAYYLSISCNHCDDPACTKVCPSGAMHKREDGFVVVDEDVCIGCRYCHMACPYGAPQYNAEKGHMTKCDGCYSRVAEGKQPICVESCPLRALEFGPIEELRQKHGTLAAVAPLPRAHFTKPNIVIKPNANSRPTGDTTGYLANPEEV